MLRIESHCLIEDFRTLLLDVRCQRAGIRGRRRRRRILGQGRIESKRGEHAGYLRPQPLDEGLDQ